MQSVDKYHKIISAMTGESAAVLRKADEELKKKEVVAVRIGKMPTKGADVQINGLLFTVDYVDYKRGKLHMSLKNAEAPDSMTDKMKPFINEA